MRSRVLVRVQIPLSTLGHLTCEQWPEISFLHYYLAEFHLLHPNTDLTTVIDLAVTSTVSYLQLTMESTARKTSSHMFPN